MFAVFDGHGGKDVSKYCAAQLGQHLSASSLYQSGADLGAALQDCFLTFDASLKEPAVRKILGELSDSVSHGDAGEPLTFHSTFCLFKGLFTNISHLFCVAHSTCCVS